MRVERAQQDTPPRPAWTAPIRWIARLLARAWQAAGSRLALFRIERDGEIDPELAELWLKLLAGDPEGTWHVWPDSAGRASHDNAPRNQASH